MAAHNLHKPGLNPTATSDDRATGGVDHAHMSRRAVLGFGSVGIVAGVALLSGCAPTATPAAKTGTVLAKLSDIPVGGSLSVDMGGNPVMLSQPTAGTVTAFSAICTHQGCKVDGQDGALACPCHGSVFSITTGEPTTGPATTALAKITVAIDAGGSVVVA